MANSSSTVTGNARVSQDRHSSYSLQQHDSATTLDLSGNMEFGKPDSLEADVKMLDQQTLRDFGMAAKRAGSVASGFASRDTSPERGSIASYRAGSRPGTAQTYSAAEVRRQYAAGPRSFASSSAKRPGLETGDIVALMSEGKAYKVSKAEVLEDEPATTNYIFQVAATDDVLSDKAAHLEVIRQGSWVGFRSAAAEDRLLQLRRRGRQKLAFFSANFGVWEQWELVAGEPKQPWNTQRMGLRNRQLQQVVLTVDVVRVGTYAMLPNASMTSRSLIPLQGDVSENEELMKMSGLMIYEWFHFVDKEKQVRIRIDGKVNQMMAEAAELKHWTISEIESIRSEMDIEVNRLIAIIHKKNVDLTDLETKLVNRLRWGIVVLQSKNENTIRRQVLQWWRMVAVYQHSCAYKVARQLLRRSQMQQAMAFDVWLQFTQHCHSVRVRMSQMATRAAYTKLAGAFAGWAQWAAASAESKMMLRELEQQAIWRMQRWRIACLLYQWRSHAQSCKSGRQCFEAMQIRNQRRRQAAAFQAWRGAVVDAAMREQAATSLAVQLQDCRMQSWLRAWQLHCLQKQTHARILKRLLSNKAQSRLNSTFQAWNSYVVNIRKRREILEAQWGREVHYIQRRAMNKWRLAVAESRRLQHASNQIQYRSTARRLWQAFAGWRAAAKRQRFWHQAVDKVLARRASEQISAVFCLWRRHAQRQRRNERLASQRLHMVRQQQLVGVMSVWRHHTAAKQKSKAVAARCHRTHAVHLLQNGLQAFRVVTEVKKARKQMVQHFHCTTQDFLVRSVFHGWQQTAESGQLQRQQLTQAIAHKADARRVATAFAGWLELHQLQQQDMQCIQFCTRRSDTRAVQQAWGAWRSGFQYRKSRKQKLAISVRRMSHKFSATAFEQWKEYLTVSKMLRLQQHHAMQHLQDVRLRQFLAAWQSVNFQQQQHKAIAQQIKSRSPYHLAAAVFAAWSQTAVESREANLKMQRVIGRMTDMRAAQVFAAWHTHVEEQRAMKAQLSKAVVRLQRLRCSAVVFGWHRLTKQSQAVQGRLSKAVRWMGQRTLASSFAAWLGHMQQVRQAKQAMQQVAARMANRHQAAAFYAWQDIAEQQHHARETAHSFMLRFQQASKAAAIDGWVEAVHIARHNRQVVAKALRRITNLKLSQAFDWWRHQAEALQDAHARAGHIIARMQNQCLAAAFQAWTEAVLERKEAETRREQLVDAAVTRSNATIVGQIFLAWMDQASQQVAMREQAASKLHRVTIGRLYGEWATPSTCLGSTSGAEACMSAFMAAWSHAVQVKQSHTRLLKRSLNRRAAAVLLSSLRAWQAWGHHRRQKRVALLRFLSKHVLNRKRHAFHRWHAAWQERCQALERLRVCISRKRISFRLFKQWYWESFDEDVQATLGHMFHTTEEAISSPLPSPQATSPRAYSPQPQGRLALAYPDSPDHGHHITHFRDFSSLYESPAGGSAEMLLLEGHDSKRLNPTQSRLSRFTSQVSDTSSAFGVTSRMFRNSSAGQALHPDDGNSNSSAPYALSSAEQPQRLHPESQALEARMTEDSGEHSREAGLYQEQGDYHEVNSVSGSAKSYALQQQEAETSLYSHKIFLQTSPGGMEMRTDNTSRISPSEGWLQPESECESSPGASSNGYGDSNLAGFARSSREFAQESPQHSTSMLQGQDESVDAHDMQYSWSAYSQPYASSAGSPGHDSLHSWTGGTPTRLSTQPDPKLLDPKTILKSIARDCQQAVTGRSPAAAVNVVTLSPQSPSMPDLSRTPNSFFNPSFDASSM